MQFFLVFLGFYLLFFSSYIDNIRGPLLPILSRLLALEYSDTSLFLSIGNIGAICATFALLFLNQHFRERTVLLAVIFFASLSCFFSLWISDKTTLWIFAFAIGTSIGTLGGMSNLLVIQGTPSKWRSPAFCALHMMYGLGSFTSPFVLSQWIKEGENRWQTALLWMPLLGILCVPLILKKLSPRLRSRENPHRLARVGFFQSYILFMMAVYVVGEVMTSMWLVSYLVGEKGMSVSQASPFLSGFFLLVALSRGLLFLSLKEKTERELLLGCLFFSCLFFFLGKLYHEWGFILVGILGPFFPVFLARLSRLFPAEANSLILLVIASIQIAQMVGHRCVGWVADAFGIGKAYWIPGIFLALTCLLLEIYFRLEAKHLTKHVVKQNRATEGA